MELEAGIRVPSIDIENYFVQWADRILELRDFCQMQQIAHQEPLTLSRRRATKEIETTDVDLF